jgi:CBS domain-containing protein
MTDFFNSYEGIKQWKDENIFGHISDMKSLNEFHDKVLNSVFTLSVKRLDKGTPPCKYSWFITGSGGRFEQGLISDQDHGIIFETHTDENAAYFSALGSELSYGLNAVGYPYCQGNVMSSNPIWCKSVNDWKNQLLAWMKASSWESIRYLQIFYDARTLKGKESFVPILKSFIYDYQKEHPYLLKRLMENILHIKNAIGPLGQLLVEEHGDHQGSIDLKYSAFLPYVNAVRLLAIKEGVQETSTLKRMSHLMRFSGYGTELEEYKKNFELLLKYRLFLFDVESYKETHFLSIKSLSKEEKKIIKKVLKDGKKLHQFVCGIIEKGC